MRFKDALNTLFLASWTVFWLAFAFRQVWLGYIPYNTRFSSGATYTAEAHPVAFYTLLAINVACILLGVFLTISHVRSAFYDARIREEEYRNAAKRQAERRENRGTFRTLTDEQKNRLVRRARKKLLAESRDPKDPHKKG